MVKYIDKVQSHEEPKLTETNGVTTIPYNIEQVTKIDELTEIEETYYSYSLGIFESSKDIAESMLEKKIKEIKISEAETYLSNTDWYYSRLAETGEIVPEDVVAKRLEARALINELEG